MSVQFDTDMTNVPSVIFIFYLIVAFAGLVPITTINHKLLYLKNNVQLKMLHGESSHEYDYKTFISESKDPFCICY